MATTYYLSATDSDLTLSGQDFDKQLVTSTEAANTIALSIAAAATESSFAFTNADDPSTDGTSGDYTVEVNITTANADVWLATTVARVNSAGTVQNESAETADQQCNNTGVLTFNFTNPSLGTWASGDRLRVKYVFMSRGAHGNDALDIGTGTTSEEVIAPWTISGGGGGTTYIQGGLINGGLINTSLINDSLVR